MLSKEMSGCRAADGKLVALKFSGNFQRGFQVMLEIGRDCARPSIELVGALPSNPELASLLLQWQQLYRSLNASSLSGNSRIQPQQIIYGGSVNRLDDCRQSATELQRQMTQWLESASFRRLDQRLRENLSLNEPIRVLIRTQDPLLRRLPWHLWNFIERYSRTEIALSAPVSEKVEVEPPVVSAHGVKILAILGNSQDIDVQADSQFLQALPNAAVTLVIEPSRQQINQQLWQQAWDVLFFAGHSATKADRGLIYINPHESLSLEELKYGLKQAIARGLQLAIFNSCDGLGLAQALESLHLPQIIVMREPVPDRVAQEFLKSLLAAYSGGKPLYLSVREAREQLQSIEDQFPCATWLPVICQNSAKIPPTWQELVTGRNNKRSQLNDPATDSCIDQIPLAIAAPQTKDTLRDCFKSASVNYIKYLWGLICRIRNGWFIVLVSLAVTVGLTTILPAVSPLNWIQDWELSVYDQMMQQRPDEGADPRLLIIEVTDADIAAQRQNGESLQRRSQSTQSFNQLVETSLSDQSLDRLLNVLEQYQPRVIGLDIYRDFSVAPNQTGLASRFRHTSKLIAICKAEDFDNPEIPSVDPPPEVPLNRVGFSDFREDSDGILRRHLLGMLPVLRTQASRCNTDRSFSVQIAFQYLQQHTVAQFTEAGDLQLGKQVSEVLSPRYWGYPPESGGSEILLNYRSTAEVATRITLQQLLSQQINPEFINDKIVLVGVTAQGGEDYWFTPTNPNVAVPGVIIQAHMISQLLSAALDQRPILAVLSRWHESGWVWTWAMMGGILAVRQWQQNIGRSATYLAISIIAAAAFLYGLCWLNLLTGKWLPFIPSLLALILSSGAVVIYSTFQSRNRFTSSSL